jgi:hypothetical protein
MGNCHKLIQGRPTQNGIEGEADLHDVEQDTFRVEVLKCPECDWEGDTSTRNDRCRAHPREWAQRLEFRHRYLQHFESCQADQIQHCTTIDKDVVQLDVDDGRGDKQWELLGPCHALRQSEASKLIDVSIHLWCGPPLGQARPPLPLGVGS